MSQIMTGVFTLLSDGGNNYMNTIFFLVSLPIFFTYCNFFVQRSTTNILNKMTLNFDVTKEDILCLINFDIFSQLK